MWSLTYLLVTFLALWRRNSGQCLVDDFYEDTFSSRDLNTGRLNFDVIRLSGPCETEPGRGERPYQFLPSATAQPPISLPTDRSLDLSAPYCIAYTGTINNANPGFVFNIMDPPFNPMSLGFLRMSMTYIRFVLGESEAIFYADLNEYVHLQICVSTGQAILYINCTESVRMPFTTTVTITDAVMTFFQNSSIDTSDIFMGSILQLYTVQCDSTVDMASLVSAQCSAIPLDCNQPSLITQGSATQTIRNVISAAVGVTTFTGVDPAQNVTVGITTSSAPGPVSGSCSVDTAGTIVGGVVAVIFIVATAAVIITIVLRGKQNKNAQQEDVISKEVKINEEHLYNVVAVAYEVINARGGRADKITLSSTKAREEFSLRENIPVRNAVGREGVANDKEISLEECPTYTSTTTPGAGDREGVAGDTNGLYETASST